MNLIRVVLICALLAPLRSTQSVVKSILFTDPKLDPQRCSLLFSFLLQRSEFSELPVTEIKPMFLNALKVPARKVDLESQLKVITNETILVEIGPSYFYGPSFFPPVWKTSMEHVNRTRLIGFGLSSGVQNSVIGAAFEHLTSQIGVAKLAYIFDSMEGEIYPFVDIRPFQFVKEEVGQFHVYRLRDFANVEDTLSQILVDGANVLVLNVAHQAALELLHKAQEKNILQHPFYWLVFNAGVTLSGDDFHVHDTNFFAVEFSTNGKFTDFTELSAIPKPITPKDLIFRDMAVVALQKLAKLLKKDLRSPVALITSTVCDNDAEKLQQTWNFYSYVDVKFDLASLYKVQISSNGSVSGNFQALIPPPEKALLLHQMRRKPFRLGTVVVPPVIMEETAKNGVVTLRGAEIVLAKELLKRLNVPYNITVFNTDPGEKINGRWTGVFGHLERWNIDLLVGPFSETLDRMITFRSTTPIRSIGYSFMYYRPSLSVSTQIFQFVVAFEASTWLLIFLTTIAIGVALALVHKISPNSLNYNIVSAIFFVFGYLFQGVRTRPPSQASSQILIVVWWFFCLILVIAFCANYASYRSFTALGTLPTTVSTLLHQEYYKYAYINGSSMELQMRVPLDPSIYALYTVINTKFKDMIPPNRSIGVEQTIKGGFALLDESPFIEYYARKYCLETSLTLWYGAYVFYMPKLLPYYKIINDELTSMIADGTVDRIYKRAQEELLASFPKYCGATINHQAIEAMRIPLVHWSDYSIEFAAALGIFVISLIGFLIVLIIMIVEFLLGIYKKTLEPGQ
ncbi:Glutamate receptor U1 [Taenia crassiceps]|uniref:Glutamate receptor U1 n=1 Tax=Taenia crassiceps TaxID=6207 RepID=A0ABR4QLQ1_9CEST